MDLKVLIKMKYVCKYPKRFGSIFRCRVLAGSGAVGLCKVALCLF